MGSFAVGGAFLNTRPCKEKPRQATRLQKNDSLWWSFELSCTNRRVWCVLTWPSVKTRMLNHNSGSQPVSALHRERQAAGQWLSYQHRTLQEKPIYFNRRWYNLSFSGPFLSENLIEMLLYPDKDISHVVTIVRCTDTVLRISNTPRGLYSIKIGPLEHLTEEMRVKNLDL